jgi:hypothetical protein
MSIMCGFAEQDMRSAITASLMMSCLPLLWATAYGGEGVEVKITNDGTEDILVTVYDTNTSPRQAVLVNTRINGFTSVPISLVGDATGKAHLSWTATSADSTSPRCGHASTAASNTDSVNVHVDSSCSV